MKVEHQQVGSVDVLKPSGALVDTDGASFIQTLLHRLKSPNPRVVLDLHEVPYADSEAMEGMLVATETLQDHAGTLKLAGVTATCREIFELTGLSPRFRFFKDVHDAVKSFM